MDAVEKENAAADFDGEEYDVVILGTGLTECILSGLLSKEGKKVLQVDRNGYYGGESASLNINQFYDKFRNSEAPEAFGKDRDWNIDLIPKFMMANGEIVKFLTHTEVTKYMEFKQISGSYVLCQGKVYKVPADGKEALQSSLLGLFDKNRLRKFLEWVKGYKQNDPNTREGLNIETDSTQTVFNKFGIKNHVEEFIGHAMALHLEDAYLQEPAKDTVEKVKLYAESALRYGKSPYLYPMYGLGELPQGFTRLSAINGGTYMLNAKEEIIYEEGKVKAVKIQLDDKIGTVHTKSVICDPSYCPDKVKHTGKVVRAYCILNHPIPNTDERDSVQIVIPQNQVQRQHDIYVACVGSELGVAQKGKFVAIVSTIVETNNPEAELIPGLSLLGTIKEKFVNILPMEEPKENGQKDQVFISRTYDATSHFETVCQDVKDLWLRVMGTPLELKRSIQEPETSG